MDYVKRFKILLSAPGDATDELKKVEEAIRQFNRTMGEAQGMMLDPKHWLTDSHPQAGDRPQEILNQQFIRDCDAVIAVFGTRFGSPTGKYQSGTEEEIEEMLKAGKPVFLYFSEVPKEPSTIDVNQFEKVKAFKLKYQSHGLYGSFKTLEEIERKVHAALSLYFLQRQETGKDAPAAVSASQSALELTSRPNDVKNPTRLMAYKVGREAYKSVFQSMENSICQKIKDVIKFIPAPKQVVSKFEDVAPQLSGALKAADIIAKFNEANSMMGAPIQVESAVQEYISGFTQRYLQLDLPEGFFYLSNLRQNRLAISTGLFDRGPHYVGDEESQKKFSLICDLERYIERYLGLEEWLAQLEPMFLVQPVLRNVGGHFDEDITVDLFLPQNTVETPHKLKMPHFECSSFVTEQLLPHLFKPQKNFEIEEYEDYPQYTLSTYVPPPFLTKSHDEVVRDRTNEYNEWIEDNFLYEIHDAKDRQVMSCRFSYLRQHTAMFFPAPLLLRRNNIEVSYRIRSKHSAKVFSGKLTIS